MFAISTSGKPMPKYLSEKHVLALNITPDILCYMLYREVDNDERHQNVSVVSGNLIDSSLSGHSYVLQAKRDISLAQFRTRPSFSDFSFFGYNIEREDLVALNFNRYLPLEKFSSNALRVGCPVRFLFPDTESTFMDALIVVTNRYKDGMFPVFCNLPADITYDDNNKKNSRGDLPLVKEYLPSLVFFGPTSITAGGSARITLSFVKGSVGLDSVCDFHLRAETGYLPRRLVRLGSGDSIDIDVMALGLAGGDSITITCGLPSIDDLASHTLAVHDMEI